jgi:uncharacterized protein YprB with RNaseH-like and TPR domain
MLNLNNLKKAEILWLYNHRCKHGSRYTEHPGCYEKEHAEDDAIIQPEKIGFLDIEASNLKADFGYIISYCIKEQKGKILEAVLKPKEIKNYTFDKNITKKLIEDLYKFDRVLVYWGKNYRFDIPYIRTRAVHWDIKFPKYREIYVQDVYDMVKPRLRLHNNRLATACKYFDIPAKDHSLNPTVWQRAMAGDKKSLDYILEHNREDVISLELLWDKLNKFVRRSKTSI